MDEDEQSRREPEPAQKFMYHAGGTLSRFLARLGGKDPDAAEQAWQDGTAQLTAGANPVLIGDAIADGIELGFDVVERRQALREYHREQIAREHGPPAYDTDELRTDSGELAGLRVLVSEPDCRFFTNDVTDELLVRTPEGGAATIPLAFTPGAIEPVDDTEHITEAIVHPITYPDTANEPEQPGEDPSENADVDKEEYLSAAREVILADPGRALLIEDGGETETGLLVSALLKQQPSVPVEDAPDIIHDAIKHVGLDTLEDRYDELIGDAADEDDGTSDDSYTSDSSGEDTDDSDG